MERKQAKWFFALFGFGVSVVLVSLLALHRQEQVFIDGAENGFAIEGMYTNGATGPRMAIQPGSDIEWQLMTGAGLVNEGRLAVTSDPNIYKLLDETGNECGWAHLAYAAKDGSDGVLYIFGDMGTLRLGKTHHVPAFIEE